MESFLELVRTRRSIRKFVDRPVEREKILACIEAARWAPSAEHVQPWRFIVVDDAELKDRLARSAFSGIYSATRWAARAPVLIALLARPDLIANRLGARLQGTHYYLLDMGIAGEHLVLQAHELGLGTCWIGWFSARGARKALGLPRRYRVVSLIAMGYPAQATLKPKTRKAIDEICRFNTSEGL
ncbi:MAG: nitroreductase family protein [candidate division KSB1 bacterium]|nr:nitroreductase family protein [candidate division KSB1 bacterium]MDZ7393222.1 nitroreductase family protein [candidate division KSB1 bacterium]